MDHGAFVLEGYAKLGGEHLDVYVDGVTARFRLGGIRVFRRSARRAGFWLVRAGGRGLFAVLDAGFGLDDVWAPGAAGDEDAWAPEAGVAPAGVGRVQTRMAQAAKTGQVSIVDTGIV